jgi:hypothetical protein
MAAEKYHSVSLWEDAWWYITDSGLHLAWEAKASAKAFVLLVRQQADAHSALGYSLQRACQSNGLNAHPACSSLGCEKILDCVELEADVHM